MDKIVRIFAAILLIIIGISAIGGGWMLINDPSGSSMQFPIELLNSTPFDNYFIPGIILFLIIGCFSLFIAILTIRNTTNYHLFLILQGLVIIIWLTVELVFNIDFYLPLYHLPLYSMSIILIAIGLQLRKINN